MTQTRQHVATRKALRTPYLQVQVLLIAPLLLRKTRVAPVPNPVSTQKLPEIGEADRSKWPKKVPDEERGNTSAGRGDDGRGFRRRAGRIGRAIRNNQIGPRGSGLRYRGKPLGAEVWRHPKDAYDVLLAVSAFVEGPEAAVNEFHAEAKARNRGFDSAIATLRKDFLTVDQDGPIRAAEFVREFVSDTAQVRQDVVTVARYLLGE